MKSLDLNGVGSKKLVKKSSEPKHGNVEVLESILSLVRQIAKDSDEPKMVAEAKIILAGFEVESDLQDVLTSISKLGNANTISVYNARLVKLLAELDKITQAWQAVVESTCPLRRAEAILFIACATGDQSNFSRAEISVSFINTDELREEILSDIGRARIDQNFRDDYFRSHCLFGDEGADVQIIKAFISQKGFKEALDVVSRVESLDFRLRGLAIIATELSRYTGE